MLMIGRLSNVKHVHTTKSHLQIQYTTPYQDPNAIFCRNIKTILKSVWNYKGPQRDKTILKQNNKFGVLTLSDFRT